MATPRQAHVDPEDLREFASTLSSLAVRIRDHGEVMSRQLSRLGETFRDQEFVKFRDHFAASRRQLLDFSEEMLALVPDLRRDADDVAESQRVNLDL